MSGDRKTRVTVKDALDALDLLDGEGGNADPQSQAAAMALVRRVLRRHALLLDAAANYLVGQGDDAPALRALLREIREIGLPNSDPAALGVTGAVSDRPVPGPTPNTPPTGDPPW